MSGWKAKRFWKEVHVVPEGQGFQVLLDSRAVRTPAKSPLILPTRRMAEAIAREWAAVVEHVDPRVMPVTRAANAAIDKVTPQFAEVAELIAAYGASDLLCYRADAPAELAAGQAAAWDPMLDWARVRLGAHMVATTGISAVTQPEESLARLKRAVLDCTPFQLTALYDLVGISGSLILGLAAAYGDFPAEQIWSLSRFDENWQSKLWGEDEEASRIAAIKKNDFLVAQAFWSLSTPE